MIKRLGYMINQSDMRRLYNSSQRPHKKCKHRVSRTDAPFETAIIICFNKTYDLMKIYDLFSFAFDQQNSRR